MICSKNRVVPLLCALAITSCFVQREFFTPVAAEEAKSKAKAKAPETPSQPVRTETVTYDTWTVSCRDTPDGRTRKVCAATLQMIMSQENRQIPVGAWIIGRNNEGALTSVVQTPQINVGILVSKGIELKVGKANPYPISFTACNAQRCEGNLAMSEPMVREMLAAANDPAVISFWKADGEKFAITIQSIKGIDKAITAIR